MKPSTNIRGVLVAFAWGCAALAVVPACSATPDTDASQVAQTTEKPAAAQPAEKPQEKNLLLDPKNPSVNEKAPDYFKVKFTTTKGDFTVEVDREWAPNGVDRFYNLVNAGFYDGCRFFRVIPNFMAQFGLNGDPKVSAAWQNAKIKDDPVKQGNKRGYLSYAMAGPNTRTTQLFINFKDNTRLDSSGFASFAKVIEGMDVVDQLYSVYGENPPETQGSIQEQGNAYLDKTFPKLDGIKTARVVK
ncbi:MAG TPA: peptidylprolyl isomerase [Candidatus Krumholzibacteria bacterium]|nr:peptidylprolyl isomerase [Candidatus Krumholzibacteria bacterium]